jgi:small-conductance mechanosensitive channel
VGYLIIICAELGLLDVSIDHLLVGAGLAGVVLGIAAQQSLGNVFASVVLLLAKPFSVGERIRIRSGALGGIFDATVLGVSLTYVTVRTDDGILKIPNSVMLATAAGPIDSNEEEPTRNSTPP